jgi:hypothetical protein
VRVAVGLARGFQIVRIAKDPAVLDRGGTTLSPRHHVVDIQPRGRAAHAAPVHWPLALPLVPLHDFPLHLGRHAGPPLRLLLDEQLQRRREDLLVRRPGLDMALPQPGLLQQDHERGRHRDVHPAFPGRERLHDGPPHLRGGPHSFGVGQIQFNWLDDHRRFHRRQERAPGDDRPPRHHIRRKHLRHDLLRLLLRTVEELLHHVGAVLLRHHLGELGDVREAEPSVSKRIDDLRELPDEPGCHLAVVGRTPGQAHLPVQVIEEARESQLAEHGQPVEFGEGEEEIDEGAVLAPGEIGDAEGPFACVHGSTISRENSPSPHARGCQGARPLARRSRTPPGVPAARARSAGEATGAFPRRPLHRTRIAPNPCQYSISLRPICPMVRRTAGPRDVPPRFWLRSSQGARGCLPQ